MAKDKKKGLGMGLDALFGEDLAPSRSEETEITQLPIEKIEPRADQPRRHFDEQALLDLSESIEKHGLIQPITVRPLDSGYFQIIAGERRWRASRKAGLETVPVHIITADEQKAMEMALVENLQREDLNPIEEALGYKTLSEEYGLTQDEISKSVGKSRPVIANAMRLLKLPEQVLDMLSAGEISSGHARALLAFEDEEMLIKTAGMIKTNDLTVRDVEKFAKKSNGSKKEPEPPPVHSRKSFYDEVELALNEHLSRKVKVRNNKDNDSGILEIEFYSEEDLANLAQLFDR